MENHFKIIWITKNKFIEVDNTKNRHKVNLKVRKNFF